MKKFLVSCMLCLAFLTAATSAFAAEWWSGWKYVNSLAYYYNGGKLTRVAVYMSESQSGGGSQTLNLYDTDVVSKADLNKMLQVLESAKAEGLQEHVRAADGNSSMYSGEQFVLDSKTP